MKTSSSILLSGLLCLLTPAPAAASTPIRWRSLQPGVAYAAVGLEAVAVNPLRPGDGKLHLVRVSPDKASLRALIASQLRVKNKTAGQWADAHGLVVAINLGMYQMDHRTHVGYLRSGSHVDSRRWVGSYRSVLAFDPRRQGLAPALLVDLRPAWRARLFANYGTVVQNLRLVRSSSDRGPGQGVWSRRRIRAWSEAALASDDRGRLLFVFCRAPYTMRAFNRLLLGLPLGVVRAMHLEGGPEASLSIRARGLRLDLAGSFETGFVEHDDNAAQWPLPNVLGVQGVVSADSAR